MQHVPTEVKTALDVASGAVAIGTIAQWLPPLAALFTVVWLGMQMFDWIVDKMQKRQRRK